MAPLHQRGALRVVSYNVHGCVLASRKVDPVRFAEIIADLDADITVLQEVDAGKSQRDGRDQAAVIGEILGVHSLYMPVEKAGLHNFGLAILSRFSIREPCFVRLPNLYPWFNPRKRGALRAVLETPGGVLRVINTHLSVFALERRIQLDALFALKWVGQAPAGAPLVFCGDLNAEPASTTYRRLSRHLTDVQVATGERCSPSPTFHSRSPVYRIDHIFVSRHLRPIQADVKRTAETEAASDHLPLIADVMFEADSQ
jgi:endonuclease/exonuclease/phosphatase family metal-dependent hydrolase